VKRAPHYVLAKAITVVYGKFCSCVNVASKTRQGGHYECCCEIVPSSNFLRIRKRVLMVWAKGIGCRKRTRRKDWVQEKGVSEGESLFGD
jgi:hypothetical protein